ncbi:hypothetical protein NECAME_17251 [Necator americanus]|uniref:Uncharacterized protein n=1 Tax=Necator americanus TaxID=51031 RepID=W2TR10_NECAM|nr:hypothetical protein NECAME_17251 [Necator americanus]ETN84114.1 hypothetical protein NECAME_17251 [Necator americanus]
MLPVETLLANSVMKLKTSVRVIPESYRDDNIRCKEIENHWRYGESHPLDERDTNFVLVTEFHKNLIKIEIDKNDNLSPMSPQAQVYLDQEHDAMEAVN